jgi:HD superfamily phosphohydrolase YqeK
MIEDNRYKHMRGVAELMYELAPENQKEDMFLLGLLHDIGYLFGAKDHNLKGGKLLRQNGYRYWQEISAHGLPETDYQSAELDLLNAADMHIDGKGKRVTFAERLADIAERYGMQSPQYTMAEQMVKMLLEKGFSD